MQVTKVSGFKQFIKGLASLVALTLVTLAIVVFSDSDSTRFAYAEGITNNDGTCDLGNPADHMVSADAFSISTAAQLWEITDCVSEAGAPQIYFELANDIVAEANPSPIGYNNDGSRDSFTGVLNGNDKTITANMSSTDYAESGDYGVGLFSLLDTATISNLFISGSFTTTTSVRDILQHSAGALAISAVGTIVLSSITNEAVVSGVDNVGGLIGWAEDRVRVTESTNSQTISGADYVGGLFGTVEGPSVIELSHNTGPVAASGSWVGGLLGLAYEVELDSSYNSGKVSSPGDYLGGLVGEAQRVAEIYQSHNSGEVGDIADPPSYVGGLVGAVGYRDGDIDAGSWALIVDSYNDSPRVSGSSSVAGLVGFVGGDVDIKTSRNSAPILADGREAGGLVGWADGDISIESSDNTGSITAQYSFGGLLGANYAGVTTIVTSNNHGEITSMGSNQENVGGLVGYLAGGSISFSSNSASGKVSTDPTKGWKVGGLIGFYDHSFDLTITDSNNAAEITGNYAVGGLIGSAKYGAPTVERSHNTGRISGDANIGGLLGEANDGVDVIDSYNAGPVTGTQDKIGGLIGADLGSTYVESSVNLGSVSGRSQVGGLVGYSFSTDFRVVGNFAPVTGTGSKIGGLLGHAYQNNGTVPMTIDQFVNQGNVSGGTDYAGIIGFSTGDVLASTGYNSGSISPAGDGLFGMFAAGGLTPVESYTTATSSSVTASSLSDLQYATNYGATWKFFGAESATWGFGSCDFIDGLPIPMVFGPLFEQTEFSGTTCIPALSTDSEIANDDTGVLVVLRAQGFVTDGTISLSDFTIDTTGTGLTANSVVVNGDGTQAVIGFNGTALQGQVLISAKPSAFTVQPARATITLSIPINLRDLPECSALEIINVPCHDSGTIARASGSVGFRLSYSNNSGVGGASFSVLAEVETSQNIFSAVENGDVATDLVILYPTSTAVGARLKTATWAMATQKAFTYTKTIETIGTIEVVKLTTSYEYIDVVRKPGCGEGQMTFGDGPQDVCESKDGTFETSANRSIDFLAATDLAWLNADTGADGGYLNYLGSSFMWGSTADTPLRFQLVGPHFKSAQDIDVLNSGSFQVYLPSALVTVLYGADFNPSTNLSLTREDEGVLTATLSGTPNVNLTQPNGGDLLIDVPTHPFSAPVFTVSSASIAAPASAPYTGPLLTVYSNTNPSIGDQVVVSGLRLNLVSSCTIDGVTAVMSNQSADSFTIVIPAGLEPGLKDLVITSSAGTLTFQDAFTVTSSAEDSAEPVSAVSAKGWTKKLSDSSAKIYAKDVVGAGKVQIFFNGKEIAWVNATSETDSKLRTANGAFYLVRTVYLVKGRKNILEVHLDGIRIRRTAYGY